MSFEDAIKPVKDGVLIDFEVTPGSKSSLVPSGYNEWRKRIEARLRSQPEKGKANEELIEALSCLLDISSSDIEIISGSTNQWKSIMIRGISMNDIKKRLRGKF
jgi:hypothetical protein